jgi:UDP-glucose 4-epimerase
LNDDGNEGKSGMTTCIVTGGAGFIGAHVARGLADEGHQVVVLDDLSGGFKENLDPRNEFVEGSIVDHRLVDDLFAKYRFDHVYHLAAYAAEALSHFNKRFNHTNNLVGTVNLINASVNHGVKCFVFTSSIAVYGEGQVPMTEEQVPQPEDSYGISKYAAEMELASTKRMFGLDYVIFRPHNVYGEFQNVGDKYRNVIGIFMNQIMRGEPLSIFGDGEQTRAFSYISDVAPFIVRSAFLPEVYGETFNVGASEPYTVNYLADVVRSAMGEPAHPVQHLPERNEVKHAFSDHSKLERSFGPAEGVTLEDGVAKMTAWAKAAGARQSKPFGEIEIEHNLPPSWTKLVK